MYNCPFKITLSSARLTTSFTYVTSTFNFRSLRLISRICHSKFQDYDSDRNKIFGYLINRFFSSDFHNEYPLKGEKRKILKSRENWFSRRQRDIEDLRCFLTNFLISRRLIIKESGEEGRWAANENKHGEKKEGGEREKRNRPPCFGGEPLDNGWQ